MNYYEKNMENIKKYKSYLYDQIEKEAKSPLDNKLDEIKSIETRDGEKAIVIQHKAVEYRLNSMYRPTVEAQTWVKQFRFHNIHTVISMFGLGNGHFARAIIENMNESDVLLIYEPSFDIFLHALQNYDISDILESKRVSITVEGINDYEFHHNLENNINISNMKSQIVCLHPQYDKVFPESNAKFNKYIKDGVSHTRININTEVYFGQKYIDNIMRNIKYFHNSNSLYDLKEGIPTSLPAIVVAAGPSVDQNIEDLKRAKGKAVIFAVDRVLDYLLDSGLEPDFVLTIDPKKPVEYFTTREEINIPLIAYMEANNDILEHHHGRKIICTQSQYLNEIYTQTNHKPPYVPPSGSVATVAFTCCILLGFKRIILVGQDLAYHGTKSHAGGVEVYLGPGSDVYVEGIDGNQIRSRYDWKEYIKRYEDTIILFPDIEVIDAKAEGAKIKGSINMSLKDAVNQFCTESFDSTALMKDMNSTFNSKDCDIIGEYFESSVRSLKIIREKSAAAIGICNTLIKESKRINQKFTESDKKIKKLRKTNKYIEEQPIYSILNSYITAKSTKYLYDMYKFTDDIKEDSINTFDKSKSVYQAIVEVIDYTKPMLEKAIKEYKEDECSEK